MQHYGDNFLPVIPDATSIPIPEHPFCGDPTCICYEDQDAIIELDQAIQDGLLTAAETIKAALDKSEQAALGAQTNAGEALTPPLCSEKVLADHQAGDEAKEIAVTVSEMCEATAYDARKIHALATQLITSDATRKLGANYSLIGDIQVNIVHAIIINRKQGSVMITVKVAGVYIYQITPTMKQQLVRLIVGKPKQRALTTLLQLPEIQAASINGNTATLPEDPGRITIVVVYRSA